ncbi:two component transcriptional regulator, LuxR family [Pilibacter termitis]|uniref:Two component transcriptional regulator, LuxR family n=1 Tax=Pilibacter termitis TaxID=263852 RepID=A0A1T4MNI0_9ENTE|nr:response regulator transcription factor [Pilibacter termitis]SJZ68670.1 two component transcriptional regulator, LuxR family [Pilibacter termitis]
MKIKLALIDDHKLVLQGMAEKLEQVANFELVGAYTEEESFLLCLQHKEIDVVVMDLMLKDSHGLDLLKTINALNEKKLRESKVILISGFYDETLHKRALELGAKAFLRKEVSYEELIACILNVAKGNHVIPEFLAVELQNPLLTNSEQTVLKLLAEEFTNEQIAKEMYISRRTVETHVSNICRKLGVNSRIGAVREGLRLKII